MPGLLPQPALVFSYEQVSAATTWNIEHNLQRYPIVDVYTEINGNMEKIMPMEVTYIDSNTCSITFSTARSGYAVVV